MAAEGRVLFTAAQSFLSCCPPLPLLLANAHALRAGGGPGGQGTATDSAACPPCLHQLPHIP